MMGEIEAAILQHPWQPGFASEIRHMRGRLEETASKKNLKRGPGGTVDIEFVVQMLQLKHAGENRNVLVPGTLDALVVLRDAGYMPRGDFEFFNQAYRFLRSIEARLRLMNTTARHDLPQDPLELKKLAWLLDYSSGEALAEETAAITRQTRERFHRVFDAAEKR
jgi:glutamate-ammonia-ligase adenylyltransferase